MITVSLYFINLYNLALFLLIFAGGSAWVYHCLKEKKENILLPAIVFSAALLIMWWRLAPIDHDEVEHLHCSWMVYSGLTPFKDFWQHHAPLVWLVCAPLFTFLKPSAFVFEFARLFSAFLSFIIVYLGWKISRKVWQAQARLSMYLLIVFSSSIMAQFLYLRPDLFMMIFLLLCVYFCLRIPGKKMFPSFFAGFFFGIGASFIFKQYLIFFLPVAVILRENSRLRFSKLFMYILGFTAGILPLVIYLVRSNTVGDFVYWVYHFNRIRLVFAAVFPVAIGVAGVWGLYVLLRRYRLSKDNEAFVILVAFCLSTVSSLKHTVVATDSGYSLAFWFLLCAIAAAGVSLPGIALKQFSLRWRSVIAGGFLSALFLVNITALTEEKELNFSSAKKVMVELAKHASDDSCLVILPYHPVFSHDATRLYSRWHFSLAAVYPQLNKDITSRDMAKQILTARPAVVQCSLMGRNLLLELFQKRLISGKDLKFLLGFLQSNYTLQWIGNEKYFIRNDRL